MTNEEGSFATLYCIKWVPREMGPFRQGSLSETGCPRSPKPMAPAGTREPEGAVGATCPHIFEAVGAPPPPPQRWTVKVVHFYLCLFLHVNLDLYQKIVGQIRGVFSFGWGLPWNPGDVCPPPPPTSKYRVFLKILTHLFSVFEVLNVCQGTCSVHETKEGYLEIF